MKYPLLAAFFLCILHLNTAKKVNVEVTLNRKHIPALFTQDEIFGVQYKNNTKDIVQLNVVIDESKALTISQTDMITSFDLIYPDVEPVIRRERARIDNRTKWAAPMLPDIFFQEYRNWPEYVAFLDYLLFTYPSVISRHYMGETIQGRAIPVFTLSTSNAEKPGFYIQAVLHAREWLANSATMYILNALTAGYGTDARITNILNNINIYIAPTVNIDGYIYSWIGSSERMWRKNRRNNNDGTFGVDLNRNYDGPAGTWCSVGASSNPSSDTYCGTAPYSEPETEAVIGFMTDAAYNISAFIDMHTSGPMILYPWGYTSTPLEQPYLDFFVNLGAELQSAIYEVHGQQYRSMSASDLYPAAGGSDDFGWSSGIVSFCFEGRGPGFNPPASNIIPAGQEQLAAVLTLAETLIDN